MSNRDSRFSDSSHTDTWNAAQQRPESGSAGEKAQNAKDDALHKAAGAMNQAEQKGQEAREKRAEILAKKGYVEDGSDRGVYPQESDAVAADRGRGWFRPLEGVQVGTVNGAGRNHHGQQSRREPGARRS